MFGCESDYNVRSYRLQVQCVQSALWKKVHCVLMLTALGHCSHHWERLLKLGRCLGAHKLVWSLRPGLQPHVLQALRLQRLESRCCVSLSCFRRVPHSEHAHGSHLSLRSFNRSRSPLYPFAMLPNFLQPSGPETTKSKINVRPKPKSS